MHRICLDRDLRAGEIAGPVEAANEDVELLGGIGFAGREGGEVAHDFFWVLLEPRDDERAEAKRRTAVERNAQARRARFGIDHGFARNDPRCRVSLCGEGTDGSRLGSEPCGLLKDRALRQSPPGPELGDGSRCSGDVGEKRSSKVDVHRGDARRQPWLDADLHGWRRSLPVDLGIDGRGEITRGFDRVGGLHLRFGDEQIQELRREVRICLPVRQREAALDGCLDLGRRGNLDAIAQRGLGLILHGSRGQAADKRCDCDERAPQVAVAVRRLR